MRRPSRPSSTTFWPPRSAPTCTAGRIFTVTRVWMSGTVGLMTWAALFVGVVLAVRGDIHAGVVYLVLFYASQVSAQLIESFMQFRTLSRGLGRAAKLVALVRTPPAVVDAPGADRTGRQRRRGALRGRQFRLSPGAASAQNFDLELQPGEHIGVVGPSGGGKSTITRLVLRLMDVDGGRILIDGQDIATCTQTSVRRAISYVPQDPQMLHRTIAENIWYGRSGPVRMDLVRRVAGAAHVEEFVQYLPEGYETVVGERGLKLSGGQRQRVAIAQAMLKAAPVLILDEATSSLDSESERFVQEALWRLMASSTALVVAHRLIDHRPTGPDHRRRGRSSRRGRDSPGAAASQCGRDLSPSLGAPIGRVPQHLRSLAHGLTACPGRQRPKCPLRSSSYKSAGWDRPSCRGTTTGNKCRT